MKKAISAIIVIIVIAAAGYFFYTQMINLGYFQPSPPQGHPHGQQMLSPELMEMPRTPGEPPASPAQPEQAAPAPNIDDF